MKLEVEKKFTMLSTKEWMQYLQHKLPADREREVNDHLQYDEFLKEAVDSINALDGRHIAFQSLNFIHQQIFETTGVSESKVINSDYYTNSNTNSFNTKKIMYIIVGIAFISIIALGLFWFLNSKSNTSENLNESENKEEVLEVDNTATQPIVDSTLMPLETIESKSPNTPSANAVSLTPAGSQNKSLGNLKTNEKKELNNNPSNQNSSTNNERSQFEQAQELYKNGKINEAKGILKKLSSYENSQTKQAESILKNIE
jgi:hypothetical protein